MTNRDDDGGHNRESDHLAIDLRRVAEILRRRSRVWVVLGGLLLGIGIGIGSLIIPQSYTSTVSLSIQQPGGATSLLAGLALPASTSRKYVGVLKSRMVAEQVERKAHIRELYDLPTDEEAVQNLSRSVVVDDNPADGLLYIHVTLQGPPRFASGASDLRDRVKDAARRAADAYADTLRAYVVDLDNDKELVLLRTAKTQLETARRDYDTSVANLAKFVQANRIGVGAALDIQSGVAGTSREAASGTDKQSAASLLQQLYAQKGKAEVELRSLEAVTGARQKLLDKQVESATALPMEDPLLYQARQRVIAAQTALDSLQIQLAPAHPDVVQARERLEQLRSRLREEAKTIQKGLTTDRVQGEVQRSNLVAQLATLSHQIATAENMLQLGREMGARFDALRGEVALKLEVLKQTASQGAVLNLQTVSAQSRIAVIDYAQIAPRGSPGLALIGIVSGLLTSLVLIALIAVDYLGSASRHRTAQAVTK